MQYQLRKRKGQNVLAVSIQTDTIKTTVFSQGLSDELFYSIRERLEHGLELTDSKMVQVLSKRLVATHRRKLKLTVKQTPKLVHTSITDRQERGYWLQRHSKRKDFVVAYVRNEKHKADRARHNRSVVLGLKK